jgi:hypothetical protein
MLEWLSLAAVCLIDAMGLGDVARASRYAIELIERSHVYSRGGCGCGRRLCSRRRARPSASSAQLASRERKQCASGGG